MTDDIIFLGVPPAAPIIRTFHHGLNRHILAFRNPKTEAYVPDYFWGQFADGTPRPPWLDERYTELCDTEGPDAAGDKANYDLSEVYKFMKEAR